MSPSDAVDLGRPCNSEFEFQVSHWYVFTVVQFCKLGLHMVHR